MRSILLIAAIGLLVISLFYFYKVKKMLDDMKPADGEDSILMRIVT